MPFVREEKVSKSLGQILQDIYIPDDALAQLQACLTVSQEDQREKLQARLTSVRKRIDQCLHGQTGRYDLSRILATHDGGMAD